MATATLTPYKNSTTTQSFVLVTSSSTSTKWILSGRDVSLPYSVEIVRKLTDSAAAANDEIHLIVRRVERNATTTKLATAQFKLILSIPKDTSVITQALQKEMLATVASLLNESTAMEATTTAITALLEGRDL